MSIDKVKEEFYSDKTITEVSKECNYSIGYISTIWKRNFTKEERYLRKQKHYKESKLGNKNPIFGKTGESHPNYLGEVSDCKGYVLILKPEWYTGRVKSKHIFYHHYIFCKETGLTEIPKGFHIHHIDHNPLNNNISNLVLCNQTAHKKLHKKCSSTLMQKV